MNAQTRAPQDDNQAAQPLAVEAVAGGPRHGDDFLDRRRVRGIAHALVPRRAAGMESGHGRGRPAATSGIEKQLGHGSP